MENRIISKQKRFQNNRQDHSFSDFNKLGQTGEACAEEIEGFAYTFVNSWFAKICQDGPLYRTGGLTFSLYLPG